jgi:hypothetical protein
MYPDDVVGLVLVDAEHGDEQKRIDELLPTWVKSRERQRDQGRNAGSSFNALAVSPRNRSLEDSGWLGWTRVAAERA